MTGKRCATPDECEVAEVRDALERLREEVGLLRRRWDMARLEIAGSYALVDVVMGDVNVLAARCGTVGVGHVDGGLVVNVEGECGVVVGGEGEWGGGVGWGADGNFPLTCKAAKPCDITCGLGGSDVLRFGA